MLTVKVKTKKVRLFIPVPYVLLNIGVSILSSEFLNRQVNKWAKESVKEKELVFIIPRFNKKELRTIVKELKNHRGIELVKVKTDDGIEVCIKP